MKKQRRTEGINPCPQAESGNKANHASYEPSADIVDIREQFPLEREDTLSVAAQLGIKHPVYPRTTIPPAMTADFLVTFRRKGILSLEAFSCKRAEDVENPRSLEKMEIERSYFNGCHIPYHISL